MADLPAQPNLRVTSECLLGPHGAAAPLTDDPQSLPPTGSTREMFSVSRARPPTCARPPAH